LFFVLSGFLITRLLTDEHRATGHLNLGAFYARRALRLLPALFLFLGLMALAGVSVAPALLQYANFQRASTDDIAPWLGHMWSLSLEEQFYVAWPVTLALGVVSMRLGPVVSALVTMAVASATLRVALWPDAETWTTELRRVLYAPDTRCDALLIGCALGLVELPHVRRPLIAAGFAGLGFACLLGTKLAMLAGLPLAIVSSAVLVAAAAQATWAPWRVVIGLGVISYGIYLWHYPIWQFVGNGGPEWALISIPAAVLFAAFSYRYVEKPFLRLKKRVRRPESPPAASIDAWRLGGYGDL
jgi:peptidoglycan/LPS O-acetylase OafA/YrhL